MVAVRRTGEDVGVASCSGCIITPNPRPPTLTDPCTTTPLLLNSQTIILSKPQPQQPSITGFKILQEFM